MPTLIRPQQNEPAEIRRAIVQAYDQIERAEPWHEVGATNEPAFKNSWANFGAADASAAFRRNVLGQVEFKGELTSPAGGATGNGTIAFSLPNGYFDAVRAQRLVGVGASGVAAPVVAVVQVAVDGSVTITLSGVAANAVVTRVTLTGMTRP